MKSEANLNQFESITPAESFFAILIKEVLTSNERGKQDLLWFKSTNKQQQTLYVDDLLLLCDWIAKKE